MAFELAGVEACFHAFEVYVCGVNVVQEICGRVWIEMTVCNEYVLDSVFLRFVAALQDVPLLTERNTPPPKVPAKTVFPSAVRELIRLFVRPEFTGCQLVPSLAERNIPSPGVAAKMFVSLTSSENICGCVKPELTGFQDVPLLVERNIPPPKVPAKMVLL